MKKIILGDNADVLPTLPEKFTRLIYIDPPFNTGKIQKRERMRVTATDGEGGRRGFGGRRYDVAKLESGSYDGRVRRLRAASSCPASRLRSAVPHRTMVHFSSISTIARCTTSRWHSIKLMGRDRFMNEIVWAYDYGGRPKSRWPSKHDTILWYARNPEDYVFNFDEMDRIPYMAPGLVTPEKAERGKHPRTCGGTRSSRPMRARRLDTHRKSRWAILNRVIKVHSRPNDVVLDFFAGSGTTGEAAAQHGRGGSC
jgi:site-specific DNA-methyltransferase (adenine-specific)